MTYSEAKQLCEQNTDRLYWLVQNGINPESKRAQQLRGIAIYYLKIYQALEPESVRQKEIAS